MAQRIALLILLASQQGFAQPATSPTSQPANRKYVAHLITFSAGRLVYERFGHNAIFISDLTVQPPVTVAYDFGNFDFNESDFVRRFVFGEMRYWAAEKDANELLYACAADNRLIQRQELNLTDDQVQQLWRNLQDNTSEQNRFYHYDYYRDNCSTRLRDHIDRVVGGQVASQLRAMPAAHSYRWHTRVCMDENRLLLSGIEFAAAADTDSGVTRWEECFLPEQLRLNLQGVTIRGSDGKVVPLVRRDGIMNTQLDRATFVATPEEPSNPLWWFAITGALLGGGLASCGAVANRSRLGRWVAAIAWGGWGVFAGLGGTLLIFMWFFTRHVSTYRNENLLQLSPLALLMVVLGPMAAFGRVVGLARWVARFLLAMCILGVMLKVLPAWRQDNLAVIAFAVVSQAGLLAGILMRGPSSVQDSAREGLK